jgi:hypothetical protein
MHLFVAGTHILTLMAEMPFTPSTCMAVEKLEARWTMLTLLASLTLRLQRPTSRTSSSSSGLRDYMTSVRVGIDGWATATMAQPKNLAALLRLKEAAKRT